MSKVVEIVKLIDYYQFALFGFVGVDIETGNIKYYSHYDRNNVYRQNELYEFDINKIDGNYKLLQNLQHCTYESRKVSPELPQELTSLLPAIILEHTKFNLSRSLPITYINLNKNNVSLEYNSGQYAFGTSSFAARYVPIRNVIQLTATKEEWETFQDYRKIEHLNYLRHEVGHMKATRIKLYENTNKLLVKTGFSSYKMTLLPCINAVNLNGEIDAFYGVHITSYVNDLEVILEEIINDLDCTLACKGFVGGYPSLGKRINTLCDDKLLEARYCHGMDIYYDSMCKIINSKDLAVELLETMLDSAYGKNPTISFEKANQLIKKYEIAKRKIQ